MIAAPRDAAETESHVGDRSGFPREGSVQRVNAISNRRFALRIIEAPVTYNLPTATAAYTPQVFTLVCLNSTTRSTGFGVLPLEWSRRPPNLNPKSCAVV